MTASIAEYRLDELRIDESSQLGEGGSAEVLRCETIDGKPMVFKRYNGEALGDLDQSALRHLIGWPAHLSEEDRQRLLAICAWPQAAVVGGTSVVGVLMAEAPAGFFRTRDRKLLPLHFSLVAVSKERAEKHGYPYYDFPHKIARLGHLLEDLQLLHASNIVIGDLQPNDILTTCPEPDANGHVTIENFLLDCDSFIVDGRSAFPPTDPANALPPYPIDGFSASTDMFKFALLVIRCLSEDLGTDSINYEIFGELLASGDIAKLEKLLALPDPGLADADLSNMAHAWENQVSRDGRLFRRTDFSVNEPWTEERRQAHLAALARDSSSTGQADRSSGAPPAAVSQATPSTEPDEPALPFHEDVHFTVYPPSFVRPGRWAPVLAFAHLGTPPAGADPRDDPIRRVRELAEATLGPRIANYTPMAQGSRIGLPEEAEITFELDLPGFDVERPERTFRWIDAFAMEKFQVRAGAQPDGRTARGRLVIYHGSFLLGEVVFVIRVHAQASEEKLPTGPPASAAAYRKIFASYSHDDTEIVEEFERHFAAIGDVYLRDVRMLRSGERWNPRLLDFIRQADVFQLFWSHNAMRSHYVEQEWRFALSLGRPNFVRPTYWERPMPEGPGLPPKELGDIHFHALGTALAVAEPPAATTASAPRPHWDEPEAAPRVSEPQTSGAPMSAPTIGSPSPPTAGPYGDYYDAASMAKGRRRSPRGRYIGAGLAAAVVALGVTFLGVTALTPSAHKVTDAAPTTASQSSGPTPVASGTAFDPSTGARLSVTVTPRGAGSELTAEISDIPRGGTARLVVIARDGTRHQIDQWVVTSYGVDIRHLTTSLSPSEIASVAIEDPPGNSYLSAPVK